MRHRAIVFVLLAVLTTGLASGSPTVAAAAAAETSWHARLSDHARIYAEPDSRRPTHREAGAGFLMFTVVGPIDGEGGPWYRVRPRGYVRAADLKIVEPTSFHGVELQAPPPHPLGWVLAPVTPISVPGAESTASPTSTAAAAQKPAELPRYAPAEALEEKKDRNGEAWVRIGEGSWVHASALRLVRPARRPRGVGPRDPWVEIDVAQQTLAAYEGDRIVYATLVSSGLDRFPTRKGLFTVAERRSLGKMSGLAGTKDSYLVQDVPNALFFDRGTALHGAYWHDKFGNQVSHGCVNLPPADAKWIYDWSGRSRGRLRVWVHASHPDAAGPVAVAERQSR
jgi:lipoprotein-anchoring transpeptidase ErfK/SrfK